MRAAYIAAGAAGMICGSCLHDNALAAALIRKGHDVTLIPTYTPIRTDEVDVSSGPVFYGALNVYLEQKSGLFRSTSLFDKLLSHKSLLNFVSKLGASRDPAELGDLTLSVLEGEHGKQAKELEKLVRWLRDDLKPEIVHITNSMLLGLAHRIREELGVPVLCSVQGEDIFFEQLAEPYRTRVHEALQRKARDVDGLIATSRYYADYMRGVLDVPAERMHTVGLGIALEDHGAEPREPDGRYVIGYLARQCPEKGLHLLIDAFAQLVRQGAEDAYLEVAGYIDARNEPYVAELRRKVEQAGLARRVTFHGEVDRRQKLDLLRRIDVLSVPTVYREPKGLFVLEALANGVPLVLPRHGSFPEILEHTGGGLLVEPESVEAVTQGLEALRRDPEGRRSMGVAGRRVVREHYNDDVMAEETLKIYRAYVDNAVSGDGSRQVG